MLPGVSEMATTYVFAFGWLQPLVTVCWINAAYLVSLKGLRVCMVTMFPMQTPVWVHSSSGANRGCLGELSEQNTPVKVRGFLAGIEILRNILVAGVSLIICHLSNAAGQTVTPRSSSTNEWVFVSFPDFFNFDVPEPWPKWEPAIEWFFYQVKKENPDFVVVAGDLVDGHWWDSPKCIEHMGAIYYEGWKRRVERYGLKYYVAVGDHELGDDPWPSNKVVLVPHFERVFAERLCMPTNGPASKKGLAYYVVHKNLLLIAVETFELVDGKVHVDVGPEQVTWMREVLAKYRNVPHKVVQGHAPVLGPLRGRSTSYLMVTNGVNSAFWQLMQEAGVDLYLCGEFHAVNCLESNGVWQIVHGSSWGRDEVETMDYLVCRVTPDALHLEMKSFPMRCGGGFMWNLNKPRGPREIVTIPETTKVRGPDVIGTLTIQKTSVGKQFLNRTGCFAR